MKAIVCSLLDPIYKFLGLIGKKINACPTKEEISKCTHSPLLKENHVKKPVKDFEKKSDSLHKGDNHIKGPEHSETKRYNHPRR